MEKQQSFKLSDIAKGNDPKSKSVSINTNQNKRFQSVLMSGNANILESDFDQRSKGSTYNRSKTNFRPKYDGISNFDQNIPNGLVDESFLTSDESDKETAQTAGK